MDESLEKAAHDVQFATDNLRAALAKSSAIESLILLPLIGQAAQLLNGIIALQHARKEANQ